MTFIAKVEYVRSHVGGVTGVGVAVCKGVARRPAEGDEELAERTALTRRATTTRPLPSRSTWRQSQSACAAWRTRRHRESLPATRRRPPTRRSWSCARAARVSARRATASSSAESESNFASFERNSRVRLLHIGRPIATGNKIHLLYAYSSVISHICQPRT
jgi:hypothetical protein